MTTSILLETVLSVGAAIGAAVLVWRIAQVARRSRPVPVPIPVSIAHRGYRNVHTRRRR